MLVKRAAKKVMTVAEKNEKGKELCDVCTFERHCCRIIKHFCLNYGCGMEGLGQSVTTIHEIPA